MDTRVGGGTPLSSPTYSGGAVASTTSSQASKLRLSKILTDRTSHRGKCRATRADTDCTSRDIVALRYVCPPFGTKAQLWPIFFS